MKITPDTNVLVRGVVRDDPAQADAADQVLRNATVIAVTLPSLCEFVWVLRKVYSIEVSDVAAAIRALLAVSTVTVNLPAVEAGMVALEAGGDFADGVIAHEGQWLGGETFVSFDRRAVGLLKAQGQRALLLS